MKKLINTLYSDKLPSSLSEEIGREYSANISKEQKKILGQFFTPAKVANFMAGLLDVNSRKKKIKILDPGCGALSLTCALVERLIDRNQKIEKIEIDAFDTDPSLEPIVTNVSRILKNWGKEKEVEIDINYSNSDFLLSHKIYFKKGFNTPIYDFIVSNPPYFKIKKEDERISIFNSPFQGQQNIYSLFLLGASKLLKKQGQLVFLVPRSFTSGVYFQSFQKLFLKEVDFEYFHLFNSRTDGFKRDKVLQENVILKAVPKNKTHSSKIKISSSQGISDLELLKEKEFSIELILKKIGKLNIIHLPINELEEEAMNLFSTWTHNLNSFGMKVSTGPVVPFRCKSHLKHRKPKNSNYVPLIWMHNCLKMKLNWPSKKKDKEAWIVDNLQSNSKTIRNQNYILLRRFSSKDDNAKLVATPHLEKKINHNKLGIENHLNYLYKPVGTLELEEVFGLSVLYNSSIFDAYIRSLSGNTQVSATELNALPLPSIDTIKKIGVQYMSLNGHGIQEIDNIVNKTFELSQKNT